MFKKREEVVVVAILAIITSALLSGYGVYYLLNLRPAKVVDEENTPSSNELQTAQTTLVNFFSYLNSEQYKEAANLYGWGHDNDPGHNLQAWAGANNIETLKNYCEAVGTCLKVKVLTGTKTSDGEYTFMVQFLTGEGKVYEYSPVVGAEATTDFNFKVKKINNQFRVINPPLYRS